MADIYKIGSRGEAVKRIQKILHLTPDGIFGKLTREKVVQFQRENGLTPDGIVGPATLAKLMPSVPVTVLSLKKSKRKIIEILVHCTATREGQDVTVEEIRRWHQQQGWSDIGYHYVVLLDGTVKDGRDVNLSGAHCSGHNSCSIGVVYVGGVASDGKTPKDTRTERQKEALLTLLKELKKMYPQAAIHGHRDYANKACPSFDATKEYEFL